MEFWWECDCGNLGWNGKDTPECQKPKCPKCGKVMKPMIRDGQQVVT
jgi:ssDNA-binding Zn-finger/Zn-ribbon topoisomerase 1